MAVDAFGLQRFVDAQEAVYERVCAELRAGRKTGHWMWFVFPQIAGLGHSAMSREFAIASKGEAEAYLAHPVLGARLIECTRLVNELPGKSIDHIFGSVDAMKFRSCMTLFHAVAPDDAFAQALNKYFDGEPDGETLRRL